MKTEWKMHPIATIREEVASLPSQFLQLLAHRGIFEKKAIDAFLKPNFQEHLYEPLLMKEMKTARDVILRHISQKGRIVVHGDYDVDGVTATRILVSTIEKLGGDVDYILPTRDEGYGLNATSVKKIIEQKVDLLVTVDCGIRDRDAIAELTTAGTEVVVTDHHELPEKLPEASAVVNPSRSDETYPFPRLCGAGVSYKLSQALLRTQETDFIFEKKLIDLAALGTLADMMPLVDENRAFVKFGVLLLSQMPRVGIRVLARAVGIEDKTMSAETLGFKIIPYLNAAGRLDTPEYAYQLLSVEDDATARDIVSHLMSVNNRRRSLTQEACEEISESVKSEDPVIFHASEKWPRGIAGLVANRLVEQHGKPALVMEILENTCVGSARSVPSVNITKVLERCAEHLVVFGGHHQAAGFTVEKDKLEVFQKAFQEELALVLMSGVNVKDIVVDLEITFRELTFDLYDFVCLLAPFGEGNAEPIFVTRNARVVDYKWAGKREEHLLVTLKDSSGQRIRAVAFRRPEWKSDIALGKTIDLVYHVKENRWNGSRRLDIHIIDWKEINHV